MSDNILDSPDVDWTAADIEADRVLKFYEILARGKIVLLAARQATTQINRLESIRVELEAEVNRLDARKKGLEKKIDDLEASMEPRLAKFEAEIKAETDKIVEVSTQEIERLGKELQAAKERYEDTIAAGEGSLGAQREEANKLQSRLDSINAEISRTRESAAKIAAGV